MGCFSSCKDTHLKAIHNSESAFNSLAGLNKYLPKGIEKAAKYLEDTGIGKIYRSTVGSELAKIAQWHGALVEYAEEIVNNVLEAALILEKKRRKRF